MDMTTPKQEAEGVSKPILIVYSFMENINPAVGILILLQPIAVLIMKNINQH